MILITRLAPAPPSKYEANIATIQAITAMNINIFFPSIRS